MQPWFIATETFISSEGYVSWSGLEHLDEVVSLDSMLCPTVLPEIKDEYWPYIVNEDFMLQFFVDLEFLLQQISHIPERNLLCVYLNPEGEPPAYSESVSFEFLGYDLVDVQGIASALTNCGGFPDVFAYNELSPKGLIESRSRGFEIQGELRAKYPEADHTDCHVWAIFRAVAL